MSTIITFPADAAARRPGLSMGRAPCTGGATILILPVVRIERETDDSNGSGPDEGAAPGRRRKRRARS
ncbi:hypothetical protein [Tardiphaga sp.]|jgi:hypothetical protein|uniref:hypothetical protein n=1 Tax=Tardiphaga sp. TaxID=1926292 RepID=UPI0019A599D7|nr:hypothetical protein [Tardiphaga sp.]MBC7579893.1 hypothetical protein [Tardiphaga sp.]